ncbi:MAG: hypothetical protein U9Q99_02465 [Nanoarchaeota archaeon]|nr:hypothetical protein [Nanoarchaeota archaeon]
MAKRRLKNHTHRGMTRRAKGAKKPMSDERKKEVKKAKEAQREANKKAN